MFPREVMYYGAVNTPPEPVPLRAGSLSMVYENGFLRYIRLGNVEVLRMIYFAVRDQNWDTIDGIISNEQVVARSDSFTISYTWTSQSEACPFIWKCSIKGTPTGEVHFEIDGEAMGAFRKNRTGFCVLHPIRECAGKPCDILTPGGITGSGQFPVYISPHQPFRNIRAMKWKPEPACEARIDFEGDVFESEDQRNWTDDSYKTYCTPLEIPFPVQLNKGDNVKQAVRLSIAGNPPKEPEDHKKRITLEYDPDYTVARPPGIGIGQSSTYDDLTDKEVRLLRQIGFHHYRVEVRFAHQNWKDRLVHAIGESVRLGIPLECVLFLGNQVALEAGRFIQICQESQTKIAFLVLLHASHKTTSASVLEQALPIFRKAFPGIKIGAGTDAYFTELNRERVDPEKPGFLSYSVNPQVHAFDHASLTETLSVQGHTVESARQLSIEKPVHISPVTLKPRFNPNATSAEPSPPPGELPSQVDVRQMSLYGAVWTLGSLINLAKAGAANLTYFETVGMRGIMQGENEPEIPGKFYTKKDMLFPMWHIFRKVLAHKESNWIPMVTSDPLIAQGIVFRQGSQAELLLANYSPRVQTVHLRLNVPSLHIGFLDAYSVEKAWGDPGFFEQVSLAHVQSEAGSFEITLNPFAIGFGKMEGS